MNYEISDLLKAAFYTLKFEQVFLLLESKVTFINVMIIDHYPSYCKKKVCHNQTFKVHIEHIAVLLLHLMYTFCFNVALHINHTMSLSWNRNWVLGPMQSQEAEHGAWLSKQRLIIQEFPLLTTSQEQQGSTAYYSAFIFIPLESVRSLKPLFDYN